MQYFWCSVLVLASIVFKYVYAANILAVTLLPSHSHHIFHEVYLLELVKKGHNVTILTHDKSDAASDNFTVLHIEGFYEIMRKSYVLEDFVNYGPMDMVSLMWEFCNEVCEYDLASPAVQKLRSYPDNFTFELIIWDIHIGQCLYPLIEKFGSPPVIATSPFGNVHFIADTLGQHIFTYIPHMMTEYSDHMTFWERLKNLIYVASLNISRRLYFIPIEFELSRIHFGPYIKPFEEIERNISLMLVNYDNYVNFPQPFAPNVIPVGGLHLKDAKPLPQDLESIFKASNNGVILFSMGSNLNPEQFDKDKLGYIIEALSRLPYTVIWKCDCKKMEIPDNFVARDWLPQNNILAHPKTKLYITHGGMHSTQEAIYHGIPIIGIPIYLDQITNIAKLVKMQVAKKLNYKTLTLEMVEDVVGEVLHNKVYAENMKRLSRKYKDKPVKPLDLAVYWTEHVLKHGSPIELDIAARDMYFYQTLNLDIIAVLLALLVTILVTVYTITSVTLKRARPPIAKIKDE